MSLIIARQVYILTKTGQKLTTEQIEANCITKEWEKYTSPTSCGGRRPSIHMLREGYKYLSSQENSSWFPGFLQQRIFWWGHLEYMGLFLRTEWALKAVNFPSPTISPGTQARADSKICGQIYKLRGTVHAFSVVFDSFDPLDCRPPGSSVHGIFQAKILEWDAISSSRGSSRPKDWTHISCVSWTAVRIFLQLSHLGNPKALLSYKSDKYSSWLVNNFNLFKII